MRGHRSSYRRCSLKKCVPENFALENACVGFSFYKVANLFLINFIKNGWLKSSSTGVFLWIAKFLRTNTCFEEHLETTALGTTTSTVFWNAPKPFMTNKGIQNKWRHNRWSKRKWENLKCFTEKVDIRTNWIQDGKMLVQIFINIVEKTSE